jgi:hypothetical protein
VTKFILINFLYLAVFVFFFKLFFVFFSPSEMGLLTSAAASTVLSTVLLLLLLGPLSSGVEGQALVYESCSVLSWEYNVQLSWVILNDTIHFQMTSASLSATVWLFFIIIIKIHFLIQFDSI